MVPILDLKRQYQSIKAELDAAIMNVVESQYFILGPEVEALEKEVAQYSGTKFAVGASSGTDALLMVMMALGFGPGDEVITTPFTFFATGGAPHRLGMKLKFVDIESDSFNLDPSQVADAITDKTKAILPVHLFGQCADMDALNIIACENEIHVLEDAAQAIGAEYISTAGGTPEVRKACNIGFAGCLSFFPSKNLGAFGDGGMVLTNDEELYAKLKATRMHGESQRYYHDFVGGNFRLDALQAAVLRVKLRHLDAWSEGRRANAARYRTLFCEAGIEEEQVTLPGLSESNAKKLDEHADLDVKLPHIYNQFTLRVKRRDELIAHMREAGIGAAIYYPLPLHMQECFAYLGYKEGDFPVAEQAAKEVLSIPVFPELTPEEQERVVSAIGAFYR